MKKISIPVSIVVLVVILLVCISSVLIAWVIVSNYYHPVVLEKKTIIAKEINRQIIEDQEIILYLRQVQSFIETTKDLRLTDGTEKKPKNKP
jgi:hypothetical protein